jgi:16S rRNA (uracil1498-N3)-methyltransferase
MVRLYTSDPALATAAPACPGAQRCDCRVTLDGDQAHHAHRVLRLRVGEDVVVFDGRGHRGQGPLQQISGGGAVVRVVDVTTAPRLRPVIDVAAAIPKGPHADAMVEQLSQVGVDRLIPLRTQRSVVDPREGKLERFARTALESAKQCGRDYLMAIADPMTLEEVLSEPNDLRLIAALASGRADSGEPDKTPTDTITGKGAGPASDFQAQLRMAHRVLVLIGPEGGWTVEEETLAVGAGCLRWSLGPFVMRIETAAVAAAALVRYLAAP